MPVYLIYDESTRFVKYGYSGDVAPENLNQGEAFIETMICPTGGNCHIVTSDGEVRSIGPLPGWGYTWDGAQWVPPPPDPVAADIEARQRRDQLLAATIDRINAFWLSSMSQEEQGECADFRQKLLDITHQTGYPFDIVWPEIPKILTFSEGGA